MKLVDEIVKSRLSLVKTRVEFSIELYRNVGNDHSSSRSVDLSVLNIKVFCFECRKKFTLHSIFLRSQILA